MQTNLRDLPEANTPFEVFSLLRRELEPSLSQIRNHQKSRIVSGVLKGLTSKSTKEGNPDQLDAYGSRLAQIMGTPGAQDLSEQLKSAPDDSSLRMGLVLHFLNEYRRDNLLAARDAYQLSLLELEQMTLSVKKVYVAAQAQTRYFASLYNFYKRDVLRLQGGDVSDETVKEQLKHLQQGVSFIQECNRLLKIDPPQGDHEVNIKELLTLKKIPFGDIKYGIDPVLKVLAHIPPAERARANLMDLLRRSERKNPLTGYHEARILEIQARMQIIRASLTQEGNDQTHSLQAVSRAVMAVRGALKNVGVNPTQPLEVAVIFKFGQLVQMQSSAYKLFHSPLPEDHKSAINEAVTLLGQISDKKGVVALQKRLGADLQ